MRLPKYFQPVGVSNRGTPMASATRSSAPLVGMLRAHPPRPPAKYGIALWFAAITATESDGVTKNCWPSTMLRSASPSQAAPKVGKLALSVPASGRPSAPSPIAATSSGAYVRFGSGWPPPKSSFGSQCSSEAGSPPSSSTNRRCAYAPATPCRPSNVNVKSPRETNARSASKSKQRFMMRSQSSAGSMTSTSKTWLRAAFSNRCTPSVSMSTSGSAAARRSDATFFVSSKMAAVSQSGAGPPLPTLNLTPKSPLGPPGLWLAGRMMPPSAPPPSRSRMTADTAGVDMRPPRPTHTRPIALPAAALTAICSVCRLQ
mmetsp:Transcript_7056/g.25105  ORF Transcript_7056/g.25105 Transcript_7056/m.25105 type:complete len:316 (+) Transcript_7056:268-1215(+)